MPDLDTKKKFKKLSNLDYNIKEKTKRYNDIFDLIEGIETNQKKLNEQQTNQKKWQREFNKLMPRSCPLCGR